MNKVILIGNLANDPEAFTTQSGVSRSTFRIAVQRRFANAQGVREADFLTVVAWRQSADFCNRYLSKGRKVAVEGSIQTRSYDAQDGTKRYVTEVVADEVEFVTPAGDGAPRQNANEAPGSQAAAPAGSAYQSTQMEQADDDDLPF